jgi:hypothetical protein
MATFKNAIDPEATLLNDLITQATQLVAQRATLSAADFTYN